MPAAQPIDLLADTDLTRFLRRHAPRGPVSGVAGMDLHQAIDLDAMWVALRARWPTAAGPPPYWAIAWPGSRALACHLLHRPMTVRGLRVLEVGCGGALAAIAASRAGAREVRAVDLDPLACRVASVNAAANGVDLQAVPGDAWAAPADPAWDVVLAADLWYEPFLARRATAWLRDCAAGGVRVLIADIGRAHAPRGGLRLLERVELDDTHGTERGARVVASVAQIEPRDAGLT